MFTFIEALDAPRNQLKPQIIYSCIGLAGRNIHAVFLQVSFKETAGEESKVSLMIFVELSSEESKKYWQLNSPAPSLHLELP